VFQEQRNRRVIPRWRDHKTTLALGELSSSKDPSPIPRSDVDALARLLSEWRSTPTIWHAADLVSSAFVVGAAGQFKDAVNFILEHRQLAPPSLVELAEKIATPTKERSVEGPDSTQDESIYRLIHSVRQRLHDEPRNALQWVELARLYTLLGESDHAIRSMAIATELGPDSRFVVRSAARLFLHERDAGRALRTIRAASGAKADPWLLAAEIAVSSASGSPSLLAKIGRSRNEDSSFPPFERTELSSALATLELEAGKNRQARQLFRQSLAAPNENSAAQVEWANRRIGGLEIVDDLVKVPRSYEACAHVAQGRGEWQLAIRNGFCWLRDQPFSKRPAIFTSYVSSLIEEYGTSIDVLRLSLKVNPGDPTLINNLAFALASANRLDEAEAVLRGTDHNAVSGMTAITLAATRGLVLFRSGHADRGRELYQLAMRRAGALSVEKYRFQADLYLAREELLANAPVARDAAKKALTAAEKSTEPDVVVIAKQVQHLYRESLPRAAVSPND
jgi:tetratricopeptide (TPR) repeat protein